MVDLKTSGKLYDFVVPVWLLQDLFSYLSG